jgi:hypothetical protein
MRLSNQGAREKFLASGFRCPHAAQVESMMVNANRGETQIIYGAPIFQKYDYSFHIQKILHSLVNFDATSGLN